MTRPVTLVVLLLAPALLGGCIGGDDPGPCTPEGARIGGEPACFRTTDGWALQGEVLRAGPDAPVAILLHGLNEDRSSWEPLARDLNRSGVTVVAYDLRGHGGSTTQFEARRTVDDLRQGDFLALPQGIGDVREALDLADRDLALVGASLGANAALIHADRVGGVTAVGLLSPGFNYEGLKTEGSAAGYEGALYMAAGKDDDYARRTVDALANETAADPVNVTVVDGAAHGTQLLDTRVGEEVRNWTVDRLDASAAPQG